MYFIKMRLDHLNFISKSFKVLSIERANTESVTAKVKLFTEILREKTEATESLWKLAQRDTRHTQT